MLRLEILEEAAEEAEEAARWYEDQCPGLGEEFLEEIDRAIDRIRESPQRWRQYGADARVRRFIVHRFPYAVVYTYDATRVLVIAVAHQHRRPGYWRSRIA